MKCNPNKIKEFTPKKLVLVRNTENLPKKIMKLTPKKIKKITSNKMNKVELKKKI